MTCGRVRPDGTCFLTLKRAECPCYRRNPDSVYAPRSDAFDGSCKAREQVAKRPLLQGGMSEIV
jgi:hypothetical protein